MSKTIAEQSLMAAARIKEAFHRSVVAGGGGRGGSPQANLNKASQTAELLASVFADHFLGLDPSFDVDAFFRACCLPAAFIERMGRARVTHTDRIASAMWREASRLVRGRKSVVDLSDPEDDNDMDPSDGDE